MDYFIALLVAFGALWMIYRLATGTWRWVSPLTNEEREALVTARDWWRNR